MSNLSTELSALASMKELGAYGIVLVVLVWLLFRFVNRWANFLEKRDSQATVLHVEAVKAITEHTAVMRTSREEVMSAVRQTGEDIKQHVTQRTEAIQPNRHAD